MITHPANFSGIGMSSPGPHLRHAASKDIKRSGLPALKSAVTSMCRAGRPTLARTLFRASKPISRSWINPLIHRMERMGRVGRNWPPLRHFPLETALARRRSDPCGHRARSRSRRTPLGVCDSVTGGALTWILSRLKHAHALGPPLQELFCADPAENVARHSTTIPILYDRRALRFSLTRLAPIKSWFFLDRTIRSRSSKTGRRNRERRSE